MPLTIKTILDKGQILRDAESLGQEVVAAIERGAAGANLSAVRGQLADMANLMARVGGAGSLASQAQLGSGGAASLMATIGPSSAAGLGQMSSAAGIAEMAVSKLTNAWHGLTGAIVGFGASVYILEAAASRITAAFESPYRAILSATEESRRFELAIQPFVGGAASARAVDSGIAANLNQSPLSLSDTRQLVEALTRIAPIAEQLASSSASQISQITGGYANTISGLQALNPQDSTQQITNAIETALLGGTRGLRSVVRIDPDQLAQLVGKDSATSFRNNPELLMSALSQYTNLFSASGSSDQLLGMPSVQIQHIKDEWQLALQQIGDSGEIGFRFYLVAQNDGKLAAKTLVCAGMTDEDSADNCRPVLLGKTAVPMCWPQCY